MTLGLPYVSFAPYSAPVTDPRLAPRHALYPPSPRYFLFRPPNASFLAYPPLPFLTTPFALPSATDEDVVPTVVGGSVFGVLPSKHRGFPSLGHRGAPETLGLPCASIAGQVQS